MHRDRDRHRHSCRYRYTHTYAHTSHLRRHVKTGAPIQQKTCDLDMAVFRSKEEACDADLCRKGAAQVRRVKDGRNPKCDICMVGERRHFRHACSKGKSNAASKLVLSDKTDLRGLTIRTETHALGRRFQLTSCNDEYVTEKMCSSASVCAGLIRQVYYSQCLSDMINEICGQNYQENLIIPCLSLRSCLQIPIGLKKRRSTNEF